MTATMKGLLKGLRYISQIFDASDEEEPEMQFGNPTDVKHVAHIGWDGPSVSSPSWMNEFKPNESSSSSAPLNFSRDGNESSTTRGLTKENGDEENISETSKTKGLPLMDSPVGEDRKHSRRRHSAGGSINSPGRDMLINNGVKPKRHQHHSSLGLEKSSQDGATATSPPSIPKKTRKKKSKEVTEGSTSSKSSGKTKSKLKGKKHSDSEPDSNSALFMDNGCPISGLKGLDLDENKDNQDLNL